MFQERNDCRRIINNINQVSRVSSKIKVPLDELQNFTADKQNELNKLKEEITFNGILNDQLLSDYNATREKLQAFMTYLPFIVKLLPLGQILCSMDIEKMVSKCISTTKLVRLETLRNSNTDVQKTVILGQTNDQSNQ